MIRRSVVIALLGLAAFGAGCTTEDKPLPYGLVWQDEFDGLAGQLPDPAKWRFDVGTDWGNLQLEYDTARAENVSLDGEGHLAITAREEDYKGQRYTSGRIKTQDLFERTHGRYEARIKLPVGQGIWPAFWMLGTNIDEVGWPDCGEIDIMEYLGQEPNAVHGTLHGSGHFGDNAVSSKHMSPTGDFNLAFHVFAVEWSAESIVWTVDGFEFHRVTPTDLPRGATWVYNHPFFILLNVAVGGRWPGSPDETTVFPQTMLVDYVRVYGTLPR